MKAFGLLLLAAAAATILYAFSMDVTVATDSGGRVVNIHLLSQQSSAQNFGAFLGVIGAVFFGFGMRKAKSTPQEPLAYDKATGALKAKEETKKCQYCAEVIQAEAIKCKHCQSDLTANV